MRQDERDLAAGHFTATPENAIKALTLYSALLSSLSSEDAVKQALGEIENVDARFPLIVSAAIQEPMEAIAKAAEIVLRIEDEEAEADDGK